MKTATPSFVQPLTATGKPAHLYQPSYPSHRVKRPNNNTPQDRDPAAADNHDSDDEVFQNMDSPVQTSPTSVNDIEGATSTTRLDHAKAEAFGARMLTLLNHGALTLMISLGHKTGLFEIMATLPATTSAELAKASKLHERYVREWLAAMYVGGIVTVDETRSTPTSGKLGVNGGSSFSSDVRFILPPENAAFLTWGRGPENVAVLSQYISILSSFEARTISCFRTGKGIPASEYGELKGIMAADSAQTIASSLIDWVLPLGQNLVVADLEAGIDVLDVECGTGINLLTMAKEYPRSWFTGYDGNAANIALARDSASKEKLHNVRFKCIQITDSMETSAYDLITCFGALVETGEIRDVVCRIHQALRPAGTFLLQDIASSSNARDNRTHPAGPLLYAISVMYSIPSTLHKTGCEEDAVGIMWGNDRALSVVREAGFKCDKPRYLPDDHCNVFFFCQKD